MSNGEKEFLSIVQKSVDFGMNFQEECVAPDDPGARVQSPYSGDWITLLAGAAHDWCPVEMRCPGSEAAGALQRELKEDGIFLLRSKHGPDGPFERTKIFSERMDLQRLPLPLRSRKRWVVPGQQRIGSLLVPVVLLSDDDGVSWRKVVVKHPSIPQQIIPPDKGLRWLQPGLYTLSDGRMLAVWNNTTPLPELDHSTQPGLDRSVQDGTWEDVFTNRDVLHAAISDDEGRSWRGFREIALNEHRNDGDFRTVGGSWALFDKSVHQNQILELPDNKILVHFGQNPVCTRTMIFDLGYLDATERKGDFFAGCRESPTDFYLAPRSNVLCEEKRRCAVSGRRACFVQSPARRCCPCRLRHRVQGGEKIPGGRCRIR
ncbi:MAG: sialidase family protein [Victivallaceae bacterium]|nr:sialidase family protein [Victivallaceae bacterium]